MRSCACAACTPQRDACLAVAWACERAVTGGVQAQATCAPGHRRPPSGERRGLVNDRRPAPHRACSWVLHFSSHPSRERRRLRVVGSHRFTVRAARAVKWGGPGHNGSWLLPILARVYAIGSTQSLALRRLEHQKHRNAVLLRAHRPPRTGSKNLLSSAPGNCATAEKTELPVSSFETRFHPISRPPSGPRGGETSSCFSKGVVIP